MEDRGERERVLAVKRKEKKERVRGWYSSFRQLTEGERLRGTGRERQRRERERVREISRSSTFMRKFPARKA